VIHELAVAFPNVDPGPPLELVAIHEVWYSQKRRRNGRRGAVARDLPLLCSSRRRERSVVKPV